MLTDDANDDQVTLLVSPAHMEPLGVKRLSIGAGAIALLIVLGVVGAIYDVGAGAPSTIDGYRVGGN